MFSQLFFNVSANTKWRRTREACLTLAVTDYAASQMAIAESLCPNVNFLPLSYHLLNE